MIDEDFIEVGQAVTVRIRIVRIGADQDLEPIRKAIAIAIEERIDRLRSILLLLVFSFRTSVCGC